MMMRMIPSRAQLSPLLQSIPRPWLLALLLIVASVVSTVQSGGRLREIHGVEQGGNSHGRVLETLTKAPDTTTRASDATLLDLISAGLGGGQGGDSENGDGGSSTTSTGQNTNTNSGASRPLPAAVVDATVVSSSNSDNTGSSSGVNVPVPEAVRKERAVVRITLVFTLELPPEGPSSDPDDGDFECFVCHLDALYRQKIHGADKLVLSHAQWRATPTHGTVTLDASIPGVMADVLYKRLESVSLSDMNIWLGRHYNEQEPFPWKQTSLVHWEGAVVVPETTHSNYFSTVNCGVARVFLEFQFFEDVVTIDPSSRSAAEGGDYEINIQNLLCSSRDYFTALFLQLLINQNKRSDRRINGQTLELDLVLDRMRYELGSSLPLTVEFDMRASLKESGRRIPAIQMMEWMKYSHWQDYIQQASWQALPYRDSVFFATRVVNFSGEIRTLNQPLPHESEASTEHCVDGVMTLPGDGGTEEGEREADPRTLITNWIIHFGFRDGFGGVGTSPSKADIEGLFCQTFFQYKDMLRRQPQGRPSSGGKFHVQDALTNLTMMSYDWTYSGSEDYPVTLFLAVEAYHDWSMTRRVDPSLLWDKIREKFNIQAFFSNYVWKEYPSPEQYFYHADTIKYEGGVMPAIDLMSLTSAAAKMSSVSCKRITLAPTDFPTSAPVTSAPTATPSVGPTIAPTESLQPTTGNTEEPTKASELAISNAQGISIGAAGTDTEQNDVSPGEESEGTEENQDEDASRGTTLSVEVGTSAIAVHLPRIPVNDGRDHVAQALAEMFTEMAASIPRRGVFRSETEGEGELAETVDEPEQPGPSNQVSRPLPGKPGTRRRRLEANIDLDSIKIGEVDAPSECSRYLGTEEGKEGPDLNDKRCSKLPISYFVETDEDPEDVEHEYVVMTQVGIETGLLQQKLDEIDPESGMILVPDPAATSDIAVAAATIPTSPPTAAPSTAPSEAEEDTEGLEVVGSREAPAEDNEPEQESEIPKWAVILITIPVVAICVVATMIGLGFRRQPNQPKDDSEAKALPQQPHSEGFTDQSDRYSEYSEYPEETIGSGLLTDQELRQDKYSDVM